MALSLDELRRLGERSRDCRIVEQAEGLRIEGPGMQHLPLAIAYARGWAGEWARLGAPSVRMGHRYAAALLATTVSPEIEIRAPWRVFAIAVPSGLISILDRDGTPRDIVVIMVHYAAPDHWTYYALADRVEYARVHTSARAMAAGTAEVPDHHDRAFMLPMDKHDDRAAALLDRLVLNTCVALTDRSQVHPLGKRPPGVEAAAGELGGGAFELRRAVTVDCREAVHEYLLGRRHSAPAVRWLVRGHWRQQPYGPGRELRRVQWIEPFWKGAEASPLAVREHELKRAAEAPRAPTPPE